MISLVTLVAISGAVLVYAQMHQSKKVASNAPSPSSTTSSQPAQTAPAQTNNSATPTNPSAVSPTPPSSPNPSSGIPKPTGQITNSYPNAVSYNDNIETTCQTVTGASCDLSVTGPDGTVKLLGAKPADQNGAVLFEWQPKQLGFSAGSWKLALVATKDGASTSGDSYNLTVNP